MQTIVDRFNLTKWVGQEEARLKLVQAGYRGQAPYVTYLFFRMVTPIVAVPVRRVLSVRGARLQPADHGQARPLHRRRLYRHAAAVDAAEEQDPEAPAVDQARLSRHARSAADLRRIRHVDRSGVQARSARKSARSRWRWPRNSRSPPPNCPICRIAARPTKTSPSAPISTA